MADKDFVVKNGLVVNTDVLVVNGSNVGINTTTPGAALEVAGTANLNGAVAITGIVTASANVSISANTTHTANVYMSSANIISGNVTVFLTGMSIAGNTSVSSANLSSVGLVVGNDSITTATGILSVSNSTMTTNVSATGVRVGNSTVNSSTLSGNALVVVGTANVTSQANVGGNVNVTGNVTAIGNVAAPSGVFSTSVNVGSASVNTSTFVIGNATANATAINIAGNTTVATATLRSSNLTIGNNTVTDVGFVRVQNSTSQANMTAIGFAAGISTVNTTAVSVGANIFMNSSTVSVGNTTVNTVISQSTTAALQVSGNASVSGNLTTANLIISNSVLGQANFAGNVAVSGNVNVTGNVYSPVGVFSSSANVGIVSLSTTQVTVGSNVAVDTAGLKVSGNSLIPTINVSAGNITIGNNTVSNTPTVQLTNASATSNLTPGGLQAGVVTVNGAGVVNVGSNVWLTTSSIVVGNTTTNLVVNTGASQFQLSLQGNAIVNGDVRIVANLIVNGTTTYAGTVEAAGNFVPISNLTFDIGTSTKYWNAQYIKTVTAPADGFVSVGNSTLNTVARVDSITVSNGSGAFANIYAGGTSVGNSTVNGQFTSTGSRIGNSSVNSVLTSTSLVIGNSTVNSTVNSTAFVGNVVAVSISGNLTGNVVATNISGNLTGNVVATNISGNLTGNVVATTITGNLTGNVIATTVNATTMNAATFQVGSAFKANTTDVITANLTVVGNLQVTGTTTFVNTAVLDVKDINITIGKGAANPAAVDGGGIFLEGANAEITYLSASNTWFSNVRFTVGNSTQNVVTSATGFTGNTVGVHTGNVVATAISGNLTGNVIATTISGNLVGNVTGNVTATTLSGNLTGNVAAITISGNLTGNVAATTISGNLTGNVSSTVTSASANVSVGANVFINTSAMVVSNSTARAFIDAISVDLGNTSVISAPQIIVQNTAGTTTINSNFISTTSISGNLTGNVVATTISGNLTGNVTGNVVATNINTTSILVGANVGVTTSTITVTNSTAYAAYNASGVRVGNSTITSSPSIAVENTAGLSAIYSNQIVSQGFVGNLTGNVAATTISGNLTGNVSAITITASANINLGATVVANTTGVYATQLNGQLASFYTNATNITTGTLPYAQIPANVINTTAAFTRSGNTTFSANVILGSSGLSANGSYGTAGHVLHSNGSATYWSADDQGVTSVASGNGLTGGPITTTGTLSVVAGTGTVVNATGVHVNATYIGTLSSNNASYLGGVAAANYLRSDTSDTMSGDLTANGISLSASGAGVERQYRWVFTGRTVYFYGTDNDKVIGLFDSVGGNRWYTTNTGGFGITGGLGVGTAPSSTAGEIRATNEITAYYSSDKNLKTNIVPIEDALGKLRKLTGVMFDWKDEVIEKRGGEDGYFVRKHDTGIIAQDVEAVLPEVVATRDDGYKAVKYEKMMGLVIQAINELADQVEEIKKKIT